RRIPAFAGRTFKQQFIKRSRTKTNGERVLLWPDTFNNYFHPETALAAVVALENAGYTVDVPQQWLCCGRPLYDYGMLTTAKRWLRRTLAVLREEIERGTPIVGLEPSCVAVFRDELCALFPDDDLAARLSRQSYLLSEFLVQRGNDFRPAALERKALVHGHCHHKAIMKMDAEVTLLKKLGLDFELLDSGCCGMAGAFGFERDHYE